MTGARILRGWGAIENFSGESRPTLLRKGYPIRKDRGGSVWADSEEIDKHRLKISEQMSTNVDISRHDARTPLK